MLLPTALLGPIILPRGTASTPRWAHCISRCCYRLLCFGQLYFWKVLPMYSDGPMALADAAANCFAWAHQISGRHCRCTQMGPSHWQMLLLITSLWPIIFVEGTANSLRWGLLPMASIWPIIFWEALPMHSDGPIPLADAANNGFTWAHQISGRHFRWAQCISRCCY